MASKITQRLILLRHAPGAALRLAVADALFPLARVNSRARMTRDRIKDSLFEATRFTLRFGTLAYQCRPSDIEPLLENHREGVYERGGFAPRRGEIVLDVGANIGEFTLPAARAVGPAGKVYAFEPHPQAVELLRENVRSNGFTNVIVIPKAVHESSGEVRIYSAPGSNVFDSVKPVFGRSYVAPACSLDDVVGSEPAIDFIKMDIEGGEADALRGARRVLAKRPRIVVEIHSHDVRREVQSLLEQAGYTCVEDDRRGDALWVAHFTSAGAQTSGARPVDQ